MKEVSTAAASNPPTFFIRNDNVPRLDLGNSMAEEICYLFTGSYTTPCAYLKTVPIDSTGFFVCQLSPTFPASPCCPSCTVGSGPIASWWIYTASFDGPTFFDGSLYRTYNSHFVSGIPSIQQSTGPCDLSSLPSNSPADYVYSCDPTYDSLSSQTEFAPCLTAPGDPVAGATSNLPTPPGNGLCAGTMQLSAISAGIQALAEFGSKALTFPVFETTVQYGYLNNGWVRVDNGNSIFGLANYFTCLDGWNPAPVVPQTIRQGFAQAANSVNPYIARTPWDLNIMGSVYDSLYVADPAAPSQIINWMTISTFQLSNTSLGYPAPAHTLTTYRFTLRPDLYFQDGRQVTSYDVVFSYLSMIGSGTFLSTGAEPMTGVTILGPHQFDVNVDSLGIFTLPNLTGLPIVPGRYWTNAGSSAWDSAVATCTMGMGCGKSQYTLSGATTICNSTSPFSCGVFPASLMTVNPADIQLHQLRSDERMLRPTSQPDGSVRSLATGHW